MKVPARFAPILLLLLTCWTAAAADYYVAPERTGTGDGKSAANAAAWFDQQAYIHANISVRQEDTTIHFAPGTYIGRKRSGVSTRCMLLDNIGNSKHRLTLLGAPDRASVFIRDPEDPTDQVSSLRLDYFFDLHQCWNITLDDLHFTGPGALSYAIRIREPHGIALRNCTFIDLTGVLYGVTCAMSGGSGVLWENCYFDNVGVSAYAHCIYNSTNVYDLTVRNCVFRDCYGEYVRFRDNCHRCTVENCLFEATGRYTGESFISCPLYNDEDPAVKTDPVYHEYFSQDLAIRNNTFIGRKRSQDFNQFVLNFLNDGYNPVGKHYLISKSEASALTTMPVEQARAWMRDRLDIDFDRIQYVNNTAIGVFGLCRYYSNPNYTAVQEYPIATYRSSADVSRLLHVQRNRSARLPDETRAVWLWNSSLSLSTVSAVAARLKADGINTVFLLGKDAYGQCIWNSSAGLAPDTDDALATYLQTFRDYGIAVHLWFVCHSDLAWANAHPEDRVWHFGRGGDPARTSGDYVCLASAYRRYFLSLVREIVLKPGKYPIEGLHIGVRFPHAMYCFCPTHTAKAAALGIDVDNVRAAVLAGFGANGTGDGEAYYARLRAGDPDVTKWVEMRESEIEGIFDDIAALLAEYQPSLVLSLSAMPECGEEDPAPARCLYAQNLASLGSVLDLVCLTSDHTAAGRPASWCTDIAVRAAARSGVPSLTGMGGSDDAAAIIADSRARGGSAGYAVFRYGTLTGPVRQALAAAGGASYAGDLNGNGRSDVLMVNAAGHTGAWLTAMDDAVSWSPLSTMAEGYAVLDFGLSSRAKNTPDIYLYNASTGVVGAWLTNALGVTGWLTVGTFDPSTAVIGLGDFNGDGISDLLLRSAAGDVGCWLGGTDETVAGWRYFQSLGPEWTIEAIGDLDGDGISDIVLRHELGYTGAWLIHGLTPAWSDLGTLRSANRIVGCGDFDGDGTDDILIRIGTACGAWMIRRGAVTAWRDLGFFSGTVEEIVDVDNDGIADLRVRTKSGDLGYFEVPQTETDPLTWHYFGSVGSEWTTSHTGL